MSCRIGIVGIVVALLLPAAMAASESQTFRERLEQELLGVRNLIQNAEAKLDKKGVGGLGRASKEDGAETPARICCSGNLKRLAKRIKSAHDVLGELQQCYERGNDRPALHSLETVRNDLEQVEKGTKAFAGAASIGLAKRALGGTTRSYLALVASVGFLSGCPATEPEP